MSDYIDTREGWREVSARDVNADQRTLIITDTHLVERPDIKRYFVRESPVPPLPTAPYTVIRIQWKNAAREVVLNRNGEWRQTLSGRRVADSYLSERLSFEVLSEPRTATVKAVLDRVDDLAGYRVAIVTTARREFGVDQ